MRDRVDTQFVGSAETVARAARRAFRRRPDADELIVTTITHSHEDRKRSHSLLAQEWFGNRPSSGQRTVERLHQ